MKMWKLLTEEDARQNWNENLAGFDDCSPFQTFEWGQFHQALGWQPRHYAFFDEEGKISSMCLILLRRFPLKTGFVWCAGGPVGRITDWDRRLPQAIIETSGLKRLYLRFRCDRERTTRDALFLNHHEWSKCIFPMVSGFSMELDLSGEPDEILSRTNRSWRRNLRLAEKQEMVISRSVNPDIGELRRILAEMESLKSLPELFSFEKLENLFKLNRANLLFLRCEDKEGNLLCFRGSLLIGNRACDYLAATSEKGRKLRASFPLFWKLLLTCREKGITRYDLGGIDPWENPGVFEFKKSTGAREIEFLGEWDWASSLWLRLFGNWLIRYRQERKSPQPPAALSKKEITPLRKAVSGPF